MYQRLLSKTSAIPLPSYLCEIQKRPQVSETWLYLCIETVPSTQFEQSTYSDHKTTLADIRSAKVTDAVATDTKCTEDSLGHLVGHANTQHLSDTHEMRSMMPTRPCLVSDGGCNHQTVIQSETIQKDGTKETATVRRLPRSEMNGTNTRGVSVASTVHTQDEKGRRLTKTISRNEAGQRVDPPINFDADVRLKLGGEKWCSNYQLKDYCPFSTCDFKHDTLDEAGKMALLSLARGSPCRRGNSCDQADCYAGHHCPYEPCKKGKACSFSKLHGNMHVHDKRIVNIEKPTLAMACRHGGYAKDGDRPRV